MFKGSSQAAVVLLSFKFGLFLFVCFFFLSWHFLTLAHMCVLGQLLFDHSSPLNAYPRCIMSTFENISIPPSSPPLFCLATMTTEMCLTVFIMADRFILEDSLWPDLNCPFKWRIVLCLTMNTCVPLQYWICPVFTNCTDHTFIFCMNLHLF